MERSWVTRGVLASAGAALILATIAAVPILYSQERSRDDAVIEFDSSMCPTGWQESVNEVQGGPGTATTELEAILVELESTPAAPDQAHDARRIVTTPEDDGFLAIDRVPESATFALVIDGVARGTVTVGRFGEHSFGALGSTWCID
jgi:hypothetical protein